MRHHYAHQHTHYGSPSGEKERKGEKGYSFPNLMKKLESTHLRNSNKFQENSRRDTPRRIKVSKDQETVLKAIREEWPLLASVSLIAPTADFYMQANGKVRKSKIYSSTKSWLNWQKLLKSKFFGTLVLISLGLQIWTGPNTVKVKLWKFWMCFLALFISAINILSLAVSLPC